jgi:hypothetical protein
LTNFYFSFLMTNLEFGSILTYARSFFFLDYIDIFSLKFSIWPTSFHFIWIYILIKIIFIYVFLCNQISSWSLFFFLPLIPPLNFLFFFPFYYFPILLHITKVLKIMKKMENGWISLRKYFWKSISLKTHEKIRGQNGLKSQTLNW